MPDRSEPGAAMTVHMKPIGVVRTDCKHVPRHWSISDVEGTLVIDSQYLKGLQDIEKGQRIVVLFTFHLSPPFTPALLLQTPPHRNKTMGVFSTCSPNRPNPIGMSVLEVFDVAGNVVSVRGLDMADGTPILDIKPHIANG